MIEERKGFRLSRRLLLGAAVVGGAVLWGGTTVARLARGPSGQKNAGRIADIDGIPLPLKPLENAPAHDPSLPWSAKGGDINDASGLSMTPVYGVVEVREEDHITKALAFARANGLKVSVAAVRHSMGGHAFDDNALVLDMRAFNKMTVDAAAKTMTLRPGACWHDIQNLLHPRFAVKAMQSTDIFSVGGSLSVNAHGMDHQSGSVAGSIRSMRVMLADGSVTTCSLSENTELFRHVVGGYGLFGVVLEATLDIVDNAVYRTSREIIKSDDFPKFFAEVLEPNRDIGLFYGHLSTAPGNFLEDMIVYRYDKVADQPPAGQPVLGEPGSVGLKRVIMNLAKRGDLFQELKWFTEKTLEPKFESCTVARTAAMAEGEACLVTRNNPMHDSVPYLFNDLVDETDILHEYFIPRAAYTSFIAEVREILRNQTLPVLNASVRIVHKEDVALNYAPEPSYSLVLYINQPTDAGGNARMRDLTRTLIDVTISHGGRFFLPYQLHYTGKELLACYPELPAFLAKKRQYDPEELFSSTFYRAIKTLSGIA
ncbi:FAD-binding oxidoreductase [Mesorhizobium sp.]|uniref:FAD-binding oxidoreductase n=1 Tax=Mesorhizobium sp. TaxID=1871066 RepID=UPI00122436CD|nr:FAD-binding oxidoreductase [Mesorhizobium sp.]TIO04190.1 MAG: FAD-binding oxidoreductase [Mesorhizobium sp.]TIO35832.1 MAG: FAD-binding oxidoreductase [Mesorhizobium sp.]TIP09620.1 MAG: FAD-binding oxidoreductase [Mesorhizobium sp.]